MEKQKTPKKIVIFSASVGSGHHMATLALRETLSSLSQNQHLKIISIDSCKLIKFSQIGNFFYYSLNSAGKIYDRVVVKKLSQRKEKYVNSLARLSKRFEKILLGVQPNLVISTHHAPALLTSYYKEKHRLVMRHLVVVTDFRANGVWPTTGVDYYIVASNEAENDLLKIGVPRQKIKTFGIPLRKNFLSTKVAKKEDDLPIVLCVAGSTHQHFYSEIIRGVKTLLKKFDDHRGFRLFVITGTNIKLKKYLLSYIKRKKIKNLKAWGFTKKIHNLMVRSTLLVTKAGGLISTEALAMSVPVIIVGPYFAQEKANTDFLIDKGVALKVKDGHKLFPVIQRLLKDKNRLLKMVENTQKIAKPDANKKILDLIKEIL